jgi:hypothetical protein
MRTETYQNFTIDAFDRLRVQHFGDETLKVFGLTPETGETELGEFETGWCARRVVLITEKVMNESGAWQFLINAEGGPAFMANAVSLKVGSRRWRVKKVEAPTGISAVWKLKAELQ